MLYFLLFGKRSQPRRAWLYALVFSGKLSALAVCFLLLSFLVQPINQAYGASSSTAETVVVPADAVAPDASAADEVVEEEVNEEIPQSEDAVVSVNDVNDESVAVPEEEAVSNVNAPKVIKASTTDTTPANQPLAGTSTVVEIENNASSSSASATDDQLEINPSPSDSIAASEQPEDTLNTVDETPADTANDNDADESDNATSDNADEEPSTNDEAASVATTTNVVKELSPLVNEQNFYQFSKQSCVSVGNGTFHCSTNNAIEPDDKAAVVARMTDEGDQEIFIRTRQGREEQLTDNDLEDTAPQYDPVSGQIVWQRKVDGRYQVMLYNIDRGKESQLTFSRGNNMEPSVSESGVVWQAWDGNDWEVMYYDGSVTDQITNNEAQDIGPTIKDDYILWSVPGESTQEAKVYSIDSKETLTVSDHEGGDIVNPRFVLVYDTRFDNGDVVTQSFDPKTGLAQPIAATPAQDPIDIPMPDPIGEIRALISNKSTKGDEVVKTISTSTTHTGLDLSASSTMSATSSTLVLTPDLDSHDAALLTSSTTVDDFELTEYDLVITPNGVSTSSATSTQP